MVELNSYPVLKEIYSKVDKYKNTVLIIISDGEITNTADVFRLVKSNPNVLYFTVGIGDNVSQNLIKGLATHGGGIHAFIGEGDKDIVSVVMKSIKISSRYIRKHQNDYNIVIDTMGGRS